LNWIHGHWGHQGARAGLNFYGNDYHGNLHFSVANVDNWLTICGRNLVASGSDGIIVNDIVKAGALGGEGNCALGINSNNNEASEWQLSKLYIWNYHLSDVDFELASSSLYSALSTNKSASVCRACPLFSRSVSGSVSMAQCECERGYARSAGGVCLQCEAGTFKTNVGNVPCEACPTGSDSAPGATLLSNCTCGAGYWDMDHHDCKTCPINSSIQKQNSTGIHDCQCNAGYEGPDGGECLPCPAGTFKLGLGSTCSDCPDGTYGIASDSPCIDCPYGTYNLVPGADSSDLCLSCGPGKYYQDLR